MIALIIDELMGNGNSNSQVDCRKGGGWGRGGRSIRFVGIERYTRVPCFEENKVRRQEQEATYNGAYLHHQNCMVYSIRTRVVHTGVQVKAIKALPGSILTLWGPSLLPCGFRSVQVNVKDGGQQVVYSIS
ncbi:hypothetical protein M0802_016349 [Mischocyttarus mexicanus]|nr:hypothetical protein M0802_016349 [Mischocyttarus mexicanus]